ncbi:hypothetical protein M9H77_16566 [Catharanthus roseus]|uniref:Uncharacterized protein n=1 Tax=Catharanthus roseus TaxID=4058 RepID=A0ACC0B2I3_CATRO|nr:hypothetical protein M9H77_16566 [Catharanthus roseus]
MANLAKLEFITPNIFGKNYLSWSLDAEIQSDAMGLGDTIKENNTTLNQDRAKTMIFLRHHLHEDFKVEYLTVKDLHILWNKLKERYDHLKLVVLTKARYDWLYLRLQDFKSINEYTSLLMKNHETRSTSSIPFPEVNATRASNSLNILSDNLDPEPRSIEDYRHRPDWLKWKDEIQSELGLLNKREVFGPVVQTPKDVKPIGYKWVFVRK